MKWKKEGRREGREEKSGEEIEGSCLLVCVCGGREVE